VADGTRTQSLGQPGEPCEQCAAPLAADQRYCLNCGRRRGEPRVDYRQQMLAGDGEPQVAQPSRAAGDTEPRSAETKGERDYAPLAAVGGIAVLGLMLLVGVLIGKGNSSTATAPAPIVRVAGGGEAEAGTASGDAGAGSSGASKNSGLDGGSGDGAGKKSKDGAKEESDGEPAVQATTDDLEELESETGEDAAKNALKLPDKIATPGAPPPIDKSKPPGGGEGGGLVIK
jgi:hypothetical protein